MIDSLKIGHSCGIVVGGKPKKMNYDKTITAFIMVFSGMPIIMLAYNQREGYFNGIFGIIWVKA